MTPARAAPIVSAGTPTPQASADEHQMDKTSIALLATIAILIATPLHGAGLKIGVGSQGPISPQAMFRIERIVGEVPGVTAVPIVPPGDAAASVRRFVAGEPDDRLDGMVVVTLPPDSFKVERDAHEASFSGSYEIYTLDLSTLAEDRHVYTFSDSELVTGGMSAILAIPAELLAERTTGTRLISGNAWQAFQSVQVRIEEKLVAATQLYMETAAIRGVPPLDRLQCARRLLDAGDLETAMAVFRSVGMDNPDVVRMISDAQQEMKKTRAETLLGRTLGAIAGGDLREAGRMLASYETEPAAEPGRVAPLRNAIATAPTAAADRAYEQVVKSDVPNLARAAFVAMVKQIFDEQAGNEPAEVELASHSIEIADQRAEKGIRTRLDGYAAALAKSAWLMSLRCGCDASANLKSDRAGSLLLQARFGPSLSRPQVGIP